MEISKEQLLTGVLVVMIILSVYQTTQLKELSGKINGNGVTASAAGGAGETYEQMIERMHGGSSSSSGTSAPASSASANAGAGMVGGC